MAEPGSLLPAVLPDPARAKTPSPNYPHWSTDDPDPRWREGNERRTKTVSRWRAEFLRDFAARLARCAARPRRRMRRGSEAIKDAPSMKVSLRLPLLVLVLTCAFIADASEGTSAAGRPRVIVTSDGEIDECSLVRFCLRQRMGYRRPHRLEFPNTTGGATSGPATNGRSLTSKPTRRFIPNLIKHDRGYPSSEFLQLARCSAT